MPALPDKIKPISTNYAIDDPGGVLRTEVAGGASRYTLDWDKGTQRFSVTLMLDKMQLSVWMAFYHYSINKGATAFDMPLDSGFGVSTHSVNIVTGSYRASRTGGILTEVTFVVETKTQAYNLTELEATTMAGLFNLYGIKPLIADYSMDDSGGVVRASIAGGAPGFALDWSRGVQHFSVTLLLSTAQFAIWSVYYARIIKKGVLAFEMPLDSGLGVSPHLVNIVPGSYSAARTSYIMWSINFVVEAETQIYSLGAAGAAGLIEIYNGNSAYSSEFLALIAKFATVDSNVLAFP